MAMSVGIKMNLNLNFMLFTNKNSKWTTDLNRKCRTIRLFRANIGENLQELGLGWVKEFFAMTPEA